MTARARYYVHGVELVAVNDTCAACGRPAVGRSISAHPLCAAHAGWAAQLADELAREVEAGKARIAAQAEADRARMQAVYARIDGATATQSPTPVINIRAMRTTAARTESRRRAMAKHNAVKSQEAREARQRLVLAVLTDAPHPLTVPALVERTRLSEHTVRRALVDLRKHITATPGVERHTRTVYALTRACRLKPVVSPR